MLKQKEMESEGMGIEWTWTEYKMSGSYEVSILMWFGHKKVWMNYKTNTWRPDTVLCS